MYGLLAGAIIWPILHYGGQIRSTHRWLIYIVVRESPYISSGLGRLSRCRPCANDKITSETYGSALSSLVIFFDRTSLEAPYTRGCALWEGKIPHFNKWHYRISHHTCVNVLVPEKLFFSKNCFFRKTVFSQWYLFCFSHLYFRNDLYFQLYFQLYEQESVFSQRYLFDKHVQTWSKCWTCR